MKTRLFTYSLLFMIVCVMTISCSSKSEVFTDNAESQELYRIQVGGKCGFINKQGKLVIEPQFDMAYWFFGDGVCYARIGGRKGLINTEGEFVAELDESIEWVEFFYNGVAEFRANKMYGIVNKSGKILYPAIYKYIQRDGFNGFIVEDTLGNQGYVNNQGEFILPCRYEDIGCFDEGLMAVARNDKYGYVDTTGMWVIDAIYKDAQRFGDGVARVQIDGKWQFVDCEGKEVSGLEYDEILTDFACNRAFVKKGNTILMVNRGGEEIANIEADSVYRFCDSYATFKKDGRFGKIDTLGRIVVQPKYERLYGTANALSIFEEHGKQGLIDTIGTVIVDANYEQIINDKHPISLVLCVNDNWRRGIYYDRKGNLIWKDMTNKHRFPNNPTKEDWMVLFDEKLSEMDPIEGLYYLEYVDTYQNRTNPSIVGSNGGDAWFCAVVRDLKTNDFVVFAEGKLNEVWRKKFVKIGDSNRYAIMDCDTTSSNKYADNSSFVMEDPYKFEFQLETGHNSDYNFYTNYTFTRDYPSESIFEQIQQPEWTGTGFAITEGFVATNYHVTNGAKTIKVRGVNGDMKEAYKAYVVASDREHDLAIIKIVDKKYEGFENIPYCIGKSIPEVGDEVFVLGYPMTNTMGQEVKLTDGIISAASGYKGDQSMYQISAAVQPGNSGGPLFDNEGNVIGIVCAKHADAENANYAIKVSYLYSLVNSSGLGIKMADGNKVKSKSLSQKVKQVKPFVYLIECYSH